MTVTIAKHQPYCTEQLSFTCTIKSYYNSDSFMEGYRSILEAKET